MRPSTRPLTMPLARPLARPSARTARTFAAFALAAAATLLAACGGTKSPDGGTPPAPDASQPEGPAFKDMTKEQKTDLMKRVVLPAMKAEFAAVEPDEFSRMNCVTCHGEGAKD